ncbi:hypothetical protein BX600DRAFT_517630 [Xylariales sp. PMI_506]|nr:hypothetical protein BX600DRAFT_517630 [Xylariales sp. PMI_506]
MPICGADRALPAIPRSKGCITCVARKTRCDGRRPTCRACENRKQVCRGYRRQDVVFLNEGWRAPGVASRVRGKPKKPGSENPAPCASGSDSPSPTSAGPLAELVLYANPIVDRSHLHSAFFLASFGARQFQAPTFIIGVFRHYFSLASSNVLDDAKHSPSPSTPVVLAVNALAQGHFGTANADTVSVRQSFHSYSMALHVMSVRLSELKKLYSDFHDLPEEDWQHLAFFCLVMMFWELKMSPGSSNWQTHIRGLAAAITLRDPDHAFSQTNFGLLAFSRLFIILQTLSARQPSLLSTSDWRHRSPLRSAWLIEMRSLLEKAQFPKASTDSIDSLMTEATTIVSIMAQYDQLLTQRSTANGEDHEDSAQTLSQLYDRAESILTCNEARLAHWNTHIYKVSLSAWLPLHPDVAVDPIAGDYWSCINQDDVRPYFDTVLSFRTMMEYHTIALYWTIVMSLHLLLSDMLMLMVRTDVHAGSANLGQKIEGHRARLLEYALRVLQSICYATLPESRAVAPFFFATSFQLTIAVMERECKFLQVAGNNEDEIQKCKSLQSLAVRYLDWARQNKISVKLDLESNGTRNSSLALEEIL